MLGPEKGTPRPRGPHGRLRENGTGSGVTGGGEGRGEEGEGRGTGSKWGASGGRQLASVDQTCHGWRVTHSSTGAGFSASASAALPPSPAISSGSVSVAM